jgi:hypothetical protein
MIASFDLLKALEANVNPSQGGHIRPQENFVRWCNEINHEIFEELARQFEKSGNISDKLRPFLRSVSVSLVPNPGQPYDTFVVPTDYRYFASARFLFAPNSTDGVPCPECCKMDGATGNLTPYVDPDEVELARINAGSDYTEVRVRKVDNQRWGSAMSHQLKKPSASRPVITAYDGGFKVAPRSLGILVLDYLRKPNDCTFLYTVGPDDQIIYDPTSQPLEWDTNVLPEFLARLESRYGVYVREDFTYQAAQLKRVQTKS